MNDVGSQLVQLRARVRSQGAPPLLFAKPSRRSTAQRAIVKKAGEAIADFNLIEAGDVVMVCLSGGKDSYALLDVLRILQRKAPIQFELLAVNVDQGWPGYDTARIADFLTREGVAHRMITEREIAEIVEATLPPDATPCSLCSRLRRGVLYTWARKLGCSKIALGHHMDDLIETLVLNMFYSGRLAAMPARLHADDEQNVVIRPLAYVPESLLIEYAQERQFPIIRCACPTCGLPGQRRQVVKRWLGEIEAETPGVKARMLAALGNVSPTHLLDVRLYPRQVEAQLPPRPPAK